MTRDTLALDDEVRAFLALAVIEILHTSEWEDGHSNETIETALSGARKVFNQLDKDTIQ